MRERRWCAGATAVCGGGSCVRERRWYAVAAVVCGSVAGSGGVPERRRHAGVAAALGAREGLG